MGLRAFLKCPYYCCIWASLQGLNCHYHSWFCHWRLCHWLDQTHY